MSRNLEMVEAAFSGRTMFLFFFFWIPQEQVPEASTSKWICLKLVSSWDLKQAHLGSWDTALGSNGD